MLKRLSDWLDTFDQIAKMFLDTSFFYQIREICAIIEGV